MTMINGRIVWAKGDLPASTRARLFAEAEAALATIDL